STTWPAPPALRGGIWRQPPSGWRRDRERTARPEPEGQEVDEPGGNPVGVKRRARAVARRAAVEVLARTDRPDRSAKAEGDIVLLMHHTPEHWLPKMDAVIEMMKQIAEPVGYAEICAEPSTPPRFSVTFDDGNKSQMKAAERLTDAGVSACFFVIADALDADEAETERICRQQLWMEPTPFMVRDDLDRLLDLGHEVGSHTLGHVNLARLSDEQLVAQIEGSRDRLAPWLGSAPHFAWPFGGPGDFSEPAYRAVADAGYVSCATGMRGMGLWRPTVDSPPLVFRQSINLDDSLPVQRRFVLNSEQHLGPSKQALAYLHRPAD
ncbi:MAG: polysaccharide deacetylase family protein, partial [Acidimicrobiales bacterium]